MDDSSKTSTDSYRFTETQDWFSGHKSLWLSLFSRLKSTTPRPHALEIGSWEGRSAVFTLENLCQQGSLTCIDHFDQFRTEAGRERFDKVTHNLCLTGRPHRIIPMFSVPGLITLLQESANNSDTESGFDWVYVDGSHEASDTFLDSELAWRLARKGAIIVFDDYRWDREPPESAHHPKRGIDGFMKLHEGEFVLISGANEGEYQMVLQKTTEMNIGFTFEGASEVAIHKELTAGWGMNIGLATDSEYAMPSAVVISSLVAATPGRITIYILDLGMTSDDIARIRKSVPTDRSDATLVFLPLPDDSLSQKQGPVWAKFDLMKILPVERVLYLDADLLVRKDLRPLWSTDLGSKFIAAAPDVGHPFGHPSLTSTPPSLYFNAGVILIDLARTRSMLDDIFLTAQKMVNSPFKDQDALNEVFRSKWLELSLGWNASGLGTYANISTPERSKLRMHEMEDPSIVHFTGPLHPPMEHVINPWVQPYVAKPWGYAGAPGHPYGSEWWQAVENTPWRGWKGSKEYSEMKKVKEEEARLVGLGKFEEAMKRDGSTV